MMLHNKVAIITGEASGIGRVAAILFSIKDASLVLCDVDKKGWTKTAAMIEKAGIITDEEAKANTMVLHPVARLGRPEEVTVAVVWLASDESSFVTGYIHCWVDGGYTVR